MCVADTDIEKPQYKVMGNLRNINESECFQRISIQNK
jgi:hypothetical protein